MTHTWPMIAAWAFAASAWAAAGPPAVPTVAKAEPAPEWDTKFAGKEGWIGGDGVYSIALGPKRVLWLFGDTLLGKVKDGSRADSAMVNNTVGVQEKGGAIRFLAGKGKDGKPAAFFTPSDGKGWFWPQAPVRVGGRLFVFLAQIDSSGKPGVFGFKHVGQWLAEVENPDDDPAAWRVQQHRVPFAEFGAGRQRSWGAAVVTDGAHLYVYGHDEERGKGIGRRRLTVARVPADKLTDFAAWRFRTADGWSAKAADAAPLASGLAAEFSVSAAPGGKGYVLVYTENGLSDKILGRFAGAPEGPWSAPLLLYRCPEMGKDKGVFSYAGRAHPWAAKGNELLLSYCVNTWDFGRLFRDAEVYRPKFVRVELGAAR